MWGCVRFDTLAAFEIHANAWLKRIQRYFKKKFWFIIRCVLIFLLVFIKVKEGLRLTLCLDIDSTGSSGTVCDVMGLQKCMAEVEYAEGADLRDNCA